MFVLRTAGFLLSCASCLFDFGTIRPLLLQFPLSNPFLSKKKKKKKKKKTGVNIARHSIPIGFKKVNL
jgi:hypothetical protein